MRSPRLFRRRQRVTESSEELEFYLETEAQANMDRGMSRDDAYLAARRKYGAGNRWQHSRVFRH